MMGPRERRPEAPEKPNGNERERRRDPTGTTFSPNQLEQTNNICLQKKLLHEHQPLLKAEEVVYGIPVIRIPVFISCLHRINSILSLLGIYLLLTSESIFAIVPPTSPSLSDHTFIVNRIKSRSSHDSESTTLPTSIVIIYTLLAMMHTPLMLPRIGIHTFVYVELLVSLVIFFRGMR